ncbi:MAG: DUF6152 family protein [Vicinamibacterales bacterium]
MFTAILTTLALPVAAHHSLAATYRLEQAQVLRGTVLQVSFRDPHTYVHLEAMDDSGVLRRWSLEWRDTAALAGTGVTRFTLRPGDHIEVVGHPSRSGDAHQMLIISLARPADGWQWGRADELD